MCYDESHDEELAPGQGTTLQVNLQLPTPPQRAHHDLAVQTNKGVLPLRVAGKIAANSSYLSVFLQMRQRSSLFSILTCEKSLAALKLSSIYFLLIRQNLN